MIKLILITIHIILCVVLVIAILLQKGKGADIGAVFGGTSQTLFGSTGAGSFLQKVTVVVAIAFILTSLGLSIFMGKVRKTSLMDKVKVPVTQQQSSKGEKK